MANKHSTLKALFQDIAESIRAKTGKTGSIIADDFPTEIDAIEAGGYEDAIIDRSLLPSIYVNNRVSCVSQYAFYNTAALVSIQFDNVKIIESHAFDLCTNLQSISFPECTNIRQRTFASCYKLESAVFPNCNAIGSEAFMANRSLSYLYFPKAKTIHNYAFAYCSSIQELDFPMLDIISGNAVFASCGSIVSASFPNLTKISGSSIFNSTAIKDNRIEFPNLVRIDGTNVLPFQLASLSAPKLSIISGVTTTGLGGAMSYIDLPALSSIGSSTFYAQIYLETVSLPQLKYVGNYAFGICTKLKEIKFPVASYIGTAAFQNDAELSRVYIGDARTIMASAFSKCYKLTALYLMGSTVCTLNNSNAFTSTPIAGYSASAGQFGSIYVPTGLYSVYKLATNWTRFASRFVSWDGEVPF